MIIKSAFGPQVLEDLKTSFLQKKNCDVIIYVGEEPNVEVVYAHSFILRMRSSYFDSALSPTWAEMKDGKFIFKKPNISKLVLQKILLYLYCGEIDINPNDGTLALDYLIAADELNLDMSFIEYVQELLIKHIMEFFSSDPLEILRTILKYDRLFYKLKDHYLNYICDRAKYIFSSEKFLLLEEEMICTILDQENLNIEEIFIWDKMIEWGIARNPSLAEKEIAKWMEDDFIILQKSLKRLIPLVRYYDIFSKDYFDKISPYEKILPEELNNDIFQYHVIKGYIPKFTKYKQRNRNKNRVRYDIPLDLKEDLFFL
ncbi:hypothetical protein RhiirA1_528877 [Rhizophagus irregularis]|uniref:BTB domain-containing protein n=1 Tax=Rhizophagus irregularis TaxID=588596 RepID=A0A2N0SIF8_9GLOM|nr:hypothetical protein RhiirA1_528877 [Rhizophagus irregularis]